ncbi:hypothetical protein ACRALDRAFT_207513 [Sodiomyces alcalophilus JCM 7366]|uniref:uncharacterized protein n=1 Tax=Sodiomyces alcalophilus JCM 7366 TaxID=591952 RepID=UPI0039B5B169
MFDNQTLPANVLKPALTNHKCPITIENSTQQGRFYILPAPNSSSGLGLYASSVEDWNPSSLTPLPPFFFFFSFPHLSCCSSSPPKTGTRSSAHFIASPRLSSRTPEPGTLDSTSPQQCSVGLPGNESAHKQDLQGIRLLRWATRRPTQVMTMPNRHSLFNNCAKNMLVTLCSITLKHDTQFPRAFQLLRTLKRWWCYQDAYPNANLNMMSRRTAKHRRSLTRIISIETRVKRKSRAEFAILKLPRTRLTGTIRRLGVVFNRRHPKKAGTNALRQWRAPRANNSRRVSASTETGTRRLPWEGKELRRSACPTSDQNPGSGDDVQTRKAAGNHVNRIRNQDESDVEVPYVESKETTHGKKYVNSIGTPIRETLGQWKRKLKQVLYVDLAAVCGSSMRAPETMGTSDFTFPTFRPESPDSKSRMSRFFLFYLVSIPGFPHPMERKIWIVRIPIRGSKHPVETNVQVRMRQKSPILVNPNPGMSVRHLHKGRPVINKARGEANLLISPEVTPTPEEVRIQFPGYEG